MGTRLLLVRPYRSSVKLGLICGETANAISCLKCMTGMNEKAGMLSSMIMIVLEVRGNVMHATRLLNVKDNDLSYVIRIKEIAFPVRQFVAPLSSLQPSS